MINAGQQAVYTHGHHESVLRAHRTRTAEDSAGYLLPHLRPGMSVLDIGCDPGTITVDLATRILPGQVTAMEITEDALNLARTEARSRNQVNVSFAVSDIHALDFPDDTFDVVHAHQVLQHVADPVRALREMRRVCVPGGIVAARDADYAGFMWSPKLPALDRWLDLYRRAARVNGGEPDAGRHLLAWAQAAGFDDVTPTASVWCFAAPDTRGWWGGMWAPAERDIGVKLSEYAARNGIKYRAAWNRYKAGRRPKVARLSAGLQELLAGSAHC